MGVIRKRSCSESDAYPPSKRLRYSSHVPVATPKDLPYSVSKHAFDTSNYSQPDAASSDVCLETVKAAYAWPRGQQQQGLVQISDTIKDPIDEIRFIHPNAERIAKGPRISRSFTFGEEDILPLPQASWASRRRAKSVPISAQDLRQSPKSTHKSLHLDKSTSREQSILPLSHNSATLKRFIRGDSLNQATLRKASRRPSKSLNFDNCLQRKQPHSPLAPVNESLRDLTGGVFHCEQGGIQETDNTQSTCLTRANLRKHAHSLRIRFAENQESFLGGALEEWAFIMSKTTGMVKEPNVTTGADEYEPNINLRNIYRTTRMPQESSAPDRPTNFSTVLGLLSGGQDVPQPSQDQYEDFLHMIRGSKMIETDVKAAYDDALPFKQLRHRNEKYFEYKEQKKWTNFEELCPDMTPHISRPAPDHSLGIFNEIFPAKAVKHMGGYAAPQWIGGPWLVLLGEDKEKDDDNGIVENMYSGAHAVNNILALKRTLGKEKSFYGEAKVFSFTAAKMSFRLSAHWVIRHHDRDLFLSHQLESWDVEKLTPQQLHDIQRACKSILDHLRYVVGPDIEVDMATLAVNLNTPGWKPAWEPPPPPPKFALGEHDSVAPEKVTTASSSRT